MRLMLPWEGAAGNATNATMGVEQQGMQLMHHGMEQHQGSTNALQAMSGTTTGTQSGGPLGLYGG